MPSMEDLSHQQVGRLIEDREQRLLGPYATSSRQSAGRDNPEDACPLRTPFQRDRDRILHSKAFRRLNHKTQVFISPVGDHFRTRLTHTLEVAQVSRTIARALSLNEDLTEAIALGHDLGHPPFGHTGEAILNEVFHENLQGNFHHEQQSVRIATLLEPMNLTHEVLEGMAQQFQSEHPTTLEAQVVKMADRMTYLHHDVEDAVRAGLMNEADLPQNILEHLGKTRHERLHTMVLSLVCESQGQIDANQPRIRMGQPIHDAMNQLRRWMFKHIYLTAPQLAQKEKVRRVVKGLFDFYCQYPEKMSQRFYENFSSKPPYGEQHSLGRIVVDYIAGMTDRYAIDQFNQHLLPRPYQPAEPSGPDHLITTIFQEEAP